MEWEIWRPRDSLVRRDAHRCPEERVGRLLRGSADDDVAGRVDVDAIAMIDQSAAPGHRIHHFPIWPQMEQERIVTSRAVAVGTTRDEDRPIRADDDACGVVTTAASPIAIP